MDIQIRQTLKQHIGPLTLALAIGALAGIGAVIFRALILSGQSIFWPEGRDFLEMVQKADWWWRLIIPCGLGLVVGPVITFWAPEVRGPGVPEVMEALALKSGRIRHRVTAIKAFVTAGLISAGASVGREGPVIQIGSSIGSSLTQLLGLSTDARRLAVACGAAAGIAATFQAPMAGTLFAVEVLLFDLEIASLSNIVISAVTGTMMARAFWSDAQVFQIPHFILVHPAELFIYFVLGLLAGAGAILLMFVIFFFPGLWCRIRIPIWLSPALGGLLVGLIGLLCPWALGVGYETIDQALAGHTSLAFAFALFFAKILTTGISIGSGMSGGIFAPSLFLGGMMGSVVGIAAQSYWPNTGINPAYYALVGMGAMVSGTTLAPITAILTIFELTYTYQVILPLMVSCIASLTVVRAFHGYSVYETKLLQKGITIVKGHEVNLLRNMTVGEHMSRDLQTLGTEATFGEIAKAMEHSAFPHFIVLDQNDRLRGVLTLRDIRKQLAHPELVTPETTAGSLMVRDVLTVTPQTDLETAFGIFAKHNLSFLPVVGSRNPDRVLGQLKKTDLLAAYEQKILKKDLIPPPRWMRSGR
ncbi:MAG TPA: chloride channel protein [Thermodesulfobacteriaceae bacterium]|nr:chloride channel protein [Thermodesulfobacteriaceae bacterium]